MNNDTRMEVRLSKKDAVGRTQCGWTLSTEPSDGYASPLALMAVVPLLLTRQELPALTRRLGSQIRMVAPCAQVLCREEVWSRGLDLNQRSVYQRRCSRGRRAELFQGSSAPTPKAGVLPLGSPSFSMLVLKTNELEKYLVVARCTQLWLRMHRVPRLFPIAKMQRNPSDRFR
jgi:hypothetical protein